MGHKRDKAACTRCQARETRAASGLCWQCRPAPAVRRVGDTIHIDGIGHLTPAAALKLAHAIADECAPWI
jgi:hypothetical protein